MPICDIPRGLYFLVVYPSLSRSFEAVLFLSLSYMRVCIGCGSIFSMTIYTPSRKENRQPIHFGKVFLQFNILVSLIVDWLREEKNLFL